MFALARRAFVCVSITDTKFVFSCVCVLCKQYLEEKYFRLYIIPFKEMNKFCTFGIQSLKNGQTLKKKFMELMLNIDTAIYTCKLP